MATINVSAFNDAAARTAGEAMTINNGAEWTVRTDYRVHANAPASNLGSLGGVTINEGKLIWDSTKTRWLAYNTGTGNVPAIGTTISQGAVSGYLLGVWASKTVAQTAVGAAMPATGFIKLRETTGGTYSAGALSGIGASATGADVQGWLSFPHDSLSNITVTRFGEHRARGGRFFLENTNGSVGQIFQVPTEGSTAFFAPGLWIETGVGTDQYEHWPGLNGANCGWAHQHIGEAQGSSDARQKFLKAIAGGQLQMGEAVTQASTYASLAAQASTYAAVDLSATYTRTNNIIEVYYSDSTGHRLSVGQQVGLDFTSGTATDAIFTIVEVGSPYHFTVDSTGADTSGNVTIRPGVTITFTAHGMNIGEQVYCDFTSGTGVNGTYSIAAVPSTSTYIISYPHTAAITSGNVSCLHSLTVTFTAHSMAIGNNVYLDFTSGTGVDGEYTIKTVPDANTYLINFPHSATTSGNVTMRRQIGLVVESGRRTWIPSNILHECATASRATNAVPHGTLPSRPEWVTTSAGVIDLEYVYGCSGYLNLLQPYSVRLLQCSVFDAVTLNEIATAFNVDGLHISAYLGTVVPITLSYCSAGGSVSNGRYFRAGAPSVAGMTISACKGVAISDCEIGIIQYARTVGALTIADCENISVERVQLTNSGIDAQRSGNCNITDIDYCDRVNGRTNATGERTVFSLTAKTQSFTVDGLTLSKHGTISHCYPRSGILLAAGSTNISVRNIGSRSAPLNCGSWSRNAYGTGSVYVAGPGVIRLRMQRIYINGVRLEFATSDNSSRDFLFESVHTGQATWVTMAAHAFNSGTFNEAFRGCLLERGTTGQTSVYGTHWADYFMGARYGKVQLLMNEPTAETAPYFTMVSGTAKYNSAGGILMGMIGNQAIWEMPYFALGHTGFPSGLAVTMGGGTITNYTLEFQHDIGSGWNGSWTVLNAANLSAITVNPAIGFKLKIRITTTSTNTTAITFLSLWTTTTPAAQDNLYPLDINTVTFTGLPTGCDTVVLTAGTTTVLEQKDSLAGTSYSYTYSGAQTVDVGFLKPGYVPYYIRNLALTTTDSSIPVALTPDRNYTA